MKTYPLTIVDDHSVAVLEVLYSLFAVIPGNGGAPVSGMSELGPVEGVLAWNDDVEGSRTVYTSHQPPADFSL